MKRKKLQKVNRKGKKNNEKKNLVKWEKQQQSMLDKPFRLK